MSGATFSPVFGRGVAAVQALSSVSMGARTLTLVSNVVGIGAGMHLFSAYPTYLGCEYLGKVLSVSLKTITFSIPARTSRSVGTDAFIVFVPAVSWQAVTVPGTGGVECSVESGIETLDTTGKELLHTQTREEREFVEIMIRDAMASDWQAYKAWVSGQLAGGLYRFMASYMDHDAGRVRTDVVKLRVPGAELKAVERARVLRSWAVDLAVVQRDYWLV